MSVEYDISKKMRHQNSHLSWWDGIEEISSKLLDSFAQIWFQHFCVFFDEILHKLILHLRSIYNIIRAKSFASPSMKV